MDKIWDRKSFEVGGHWSLWREWKNRMITQNRQKSNAKKKLKNKHATGIGKNTLVKEIPLADLDSWLLTFNSLTFIGKHFWLFVITLYCLYLLLYSMTGVGKLVLNWIFVSANLQQNKIAFLVTTDLHVSKEKFLILGIY